MSNRSNRNRNKPTKNQAPIVPKESIETSAKNEKSNQIDNKNQETDLVEGLKKRKIIKYLIVITPILVGIYYVIANFPNFYQGWKFAKTLNTAHKPAPIFESHKKSFNVVILPLFPYQNYLEVPTNYERAFKERLEYFKDSLSYDMTIKYDSLSKWENDSLAIAIGQYNNADLIIWGGFIKNNLNPTKIKLKYKLNKSAIPIFQPNDKYNLGYRMLNSFDEIDSGFLTEDIELIIQFIFGMKYYIRNDFVHALKTFYSIRKHKSFKHESELNTAIMYTYMQLALDSIDDIGLSKIKAEFDIFPLKYYLARNMYLNDKLDYDLYLVCNEALLTDSLEPFMKMQILYWLSNLTYHQELYSECLKYLKEMIDSINTNISDELFIWSHFNNLAFAYDMTYRIYYKTGQYSKGLGIKSNIPETYRNENIKLLDWRIIFLGLNNKYQEAYNLADSMMNNNSFTSDTEFRLLSLKKILNGDDKARIDWKHVELLPK